MQLPHYFGPTARLHHIGIAVRSIAEIAPEAIVHDDPIQNVRVSFVRLADAQCELVEAAAPDAPVAALVAKGQSFYHLCFEVDDLEAALTTARQFGFRRLRPPVPAAAFQGRLICWVFSRALGLFELVSTKQPMPKT